MDWAAAAVSEIEAGYRLMALVFKMILQRYAKLWGFVAGHGGQPWLRKRG